MFNLLHQTDVPSIFLSLSKIYQAHVHVHPFDGTQYNMIKTAALRKKCFEPFSSLYYEQSAKQILVFVLEYSLTSLVQINRI